MHELDTEELVQRAGAWRSVGRCSGCSIAITGRDCERWSPCGWMPGSSYDSIRRTSFRRRWSKPSRSSLFTCANDRCLSTPGCDKSPGIGSSICIGSMCLPSSDRCREKSRWRHCSRGGRPGTWCVDQLLARESHPASERHRPSGTDRSGCARQLTGCRLRTAKCSFCGSTLKTCIGQRGGGHSPRRQKRP